VVQIYYLNQLQSATQNQVGQRAWLLNRASEAGCPVVPGFVFPANLFQECLRSIDWTQFEDIEAETLRLQVPIHGHWQRQQLAQQLVQAVLNTHLSETWLDAIRQAVSQLDSGIVTLQPSLSVDGLEGSTITSLLSLWKSEVCLGNVEAIAQGIRSLHSQVLSAHSLLYWQQQDIALTQIQFAVILQPLSSVYCSGSLVSSPTELMIQAVWGLPDVLLSGESVPTQERYSHNGNLLEHQQGYQSIAYSLKSSASHLDTQAVLLPDFLVKPNIELNPSSNDIVQVYQLRQAVAQQEPLDAQQCEQLMELAQTLDLQIDRPYSVTWLYTQTTPDNSLQLQLSTLDLISSTDQSAITPKSDRDPNRDDDHLSLVSTQSYPIFRGIAASPGQVIANVLVLKHMPTNPLPANTIVVAATIQPSWLPMLQQVAGLVTEGGGLTSHSAILARELGIPAVVGMSHITEQLESGETVLLDGDRGEVHYRLPSLKQAGREHAHLAASQSDTLRRHNDLLASWPQATTQTQNPMIATQLMVNLSQVKSIDQIQVPVDGVGLLRSELMILELLEQQHPQHWLEQGRQPELIQRIAQTVTHFVSAFDPQPVFYRFLDLRVHEFQFLTHPSMATMNPALGIRGTFSYQLDPTLFDLELAALQQVWQDGFENLVLLLPFVRTVEEFRFCQRRIEHQWAGSEPIPPLWIMAEVPSVLFLMTDFVNAGVQGITIGTSDLAQLLLAADRDDPQLSKLSMGHPVVQRAIAQLIQQAQQLEIPCHICGDYLATHCPALIDSLIQWGITAISVDVSALDATYHAIARAERRLLLRSACQSFSSEL
jgi:pyruvate, water dikinase